MSNELDGNIALVTGAASGIGAACAIAIATAGAQVIVADRQAGNETVRHIIEAGGDASQIMCDVSNPKSVAALFKQILKKYGALDFAVNSAGILKEGRLLDMSIEDFDRIIAVNLRGTFLIAQGAVRLMQNGSDIWPYKGRIITISSELALLGRANFSAYCASKSGVVGLTRSLARELAPDILVNSVAPGPVDTPMLGLENMSPKWRKEETDIPLGRVGKPEEIAAMVCFLLGPGGDFITGQTISPNGGAVMA